MHEFLHTLGAKHEDAYYQIMGNAWNVVSTNGCYTHVAVSEDTTAGLVSVYGQRAGSFEDLSLSHWKWKAASGGYSKHERTALYDASAQSCPCRALRAGVPATTASCTRRRRAT